MHLFEKYMFILCNKTYKQALPNLFNDDDRCNSCRGKDLTQHFLISLIILLQKVLMVIYEYN